MNVHRVTRRPPVEMLTDARLHALPERPSRRHSGRPESLLGFHDQLRRGDLLGPERPRRRDGLGSRRWRRDRRDALRMAGVRSMFGEEAFEGLADEVGVDGRAVGFGEDCSRLCGGGRWPCDLRRSVRRVALEAGPRSVNDGGELGLGSDGPELEPPAWPPR